MRPLSCDLVIGVAAAAVRSGVCVCVERGEFINNFIILSAFVEMGIRVALFGLMGLSLFKG